MKTALLIILAIGLILFGLFAMFPSKEGGEQGQISEEALIDAWLEGNNLNQYGDPKDTMYLGGTPLFDERTGTRIDRYEYIKRNHPNKPWMK